MNDLALFFNINEVDVKRLMLCLGGKKISFKKDMTILSNVGNVGVIGIIVTGSASLVRYNYNGSRTIIEKLERDSMFGDKFSAFDNNDLSVIANTDCEVLFIEYNNIFKRCKKNCECHSAFISNMLNLLSSKIITMNERIEVLTKRSIREKLLDYFNILAKKKNSRKFTIPFSFTDLADYLSVDRSAMSREIKNLKDEGFIIVEGKKITLLF